jgi:ribonuclease P protein component
VFAALRDAPAVRADGVQVRYLVGDEAGARPVFAYGIGRVHGNAVARNRIRRRLRESVRQRAGGLPPGRYLVSVRPGVPTTFRHLDAALARCVEQLLARLS